MAHSRSSHESSRTASESTVTGRRPSTSASSLRTQTDVASTLSTGRPSAASTYTESSVNQGEVLRSDGASETRSIAMESMHIEEEEGRLTSDLPPVDGGRAAWAYLISATILETLVWGLPSAYGVFLLEYERLFPEAVTLLPQIGTVTTGIMYLLLPPLALHLSAHPRQRPLSMWIGVALTAIGLVGAAYSNQPWQLLVTQGVLFALGGIFLYCPVTSYLFEWWTQRRGFASGVLFSGTGIGGLTFPFIASASLDKFGRKTTLLGFAVAYTVALCATIPFIKPRIPVARDGAAPRRQTKLDWSFLHGRRFWLLFVGVLLQGLGGFIPATYIPSFASSIHLNSTAGTLSLAAMNGSRVIGQVLIGHMADTMGPRKLILGMSLLSSVSVYVLWGVATNEATLLVFSIVFGAFAGSYTALFPKFISLVSENDPRLPSILYAAFSFARGLGNIASGPVSTKLLATPLRHVRGGYGVEGYGLLILWTGAMLLGSGVGAGYKGLKRD